MGLECALLARPSSLFLHRPSGWDGRVSCPTRSQVHPWPVRILPGIPFMSVKARNQQAAEVSFSTCSVQGLCLPVPPTTLLSPSGSLHTSAHGSSSEFPLPPLISVLAVSLHDSASMYLVSPWLALRESRWNKSEAPGRNERFLKRLAPFAPSSYSQGALDGTDHKVDPPSLPCFPNPAARETHRQRRGSKSSFSKPSFPPPE